MSKDDDLRNIMNDDDDDFFGSDADIDPDQSFDFGDEDFGEEISDEENASPGERQGPSRAFIFLAILLILILLGGFAVLIFAITQGGGDPLDPTRTAIAQANATTLAQVAQAEASATAETIITQTASASSPTPSPSPSPTIDISATAQIINATITAQAAGLIATQQAIQITQQAIEAAQTATVLALNNPLSDVDQTATALALGQGGGQDDATPTPERTGGSLSVADVQATATQLALVFSQPTPTIAGASGGGFLPTPTAITGTIRGTPIAGGNLPDTGLFDDLGANPALFFLMALGLLGVIAVARGLRSGTRK
jgi:cytoskeletal protein RodZ